MANIFVSYKNEDRDYREAFEGLMQNPNTNFNHQPVSARRDYRYLGYDEVQKYLNRLIQPCLALVCLISQNTYQSTWIDHELSVASSLKIGIVPICITNTRYIIPSMIASKKLHICDWDVDDIHRGLNKAFQYTVNHR